MPDAPAIPAAAAGVDSPATAVTSAVAAVTSGEISSAYRDGGGGGRSFRQLVALQQFRLICKATGAGGRLLLAAFLLR